ncbi:MAG: ATP-binding protein [Actinomycetes bacterium]
MAQSLRGRIVLAFGLGTLVLTSLLAVFTFLLSRSYLLEQRQRSVVRQAYVDAALVRDQLSTTGANVQHALDAVDPRSATALVLHRGDQWFSSSLDLGASALPGRLVREVDSGRPAYLRTDIAGVPSLVVGVPLPAVGATVYEVAPLTELDQSLELLAIVLAVGAVVATAGGLLLGVYASRRVVQPLYSVAGTAADIAAGSLASRLPATEDPDLATIVGSFNSMVDALAGRIAQDARFAADVSHELRSPLTTLVASVDVLRGRSEELSPRGRQALDMVERELVRFARLLDDLIELARSDADAGLHQTRLQLADLVRATLASGLYAPELLVVERDVAVHADKLRLERALVNLLQNADHHGHGLVRVTVTASRQEAFVWVDDAGPGVPVELRERIFERFATAGSGRGSSQGSGLGLALVRETVGQHEGAVWCVDRPDGPGARFVVTLPAVVA